MTSKQSVKQQQKGTLKFKRLSDHADHDEEVHWCDEHRCLYSGDWDDHGSCTPNKVPSATGTSTDLCLDETRRLKHVVHDLNRLLSLVNSTQKRLGQNGDDIHEVHAKAVKDFKEFRAEINEVLDRAEKEFLNTVTTMKDRDTTRLVIATGKCDVLKLRAKRTLTALKYSQSSGLVDDLYTEVKTAESSLSLMMEEAKTFIDKEFVTRYSFKDQTDSLKSLSDVERYINQVSSKQLAPEFVCDINMKSEGDGSDCLVSGIAILPPGRVIIADSKNKCVKLLNTVDRSVTSRLPLPAKPFDVAALNDQQIAVSLGTAKKIAMVSVENDTLTAKSFIDVSRCLGIASCNNGILGVDQHPGSLKIYQPDGATSSVFEKDEDGKALFDMPRYVATSADDNFIYVTDFNSNTVTCLTSEGATVSVFKEDSVKRPYGVTTDGATGRVYVSCMDTHSVYQFSATCREMRTLLDGKTGLPPCPGCIEYCSKTGRLFVSTRSKMGEIRNTLKLYKFK